MSAWILIFSILFGMLILYIAWCCCVHQSRTTQIRKSKKFDQADAHRREMRSLTSTPSNPAARVPSSAPSDTIVLIQDQSPWVSVSFPRPMVTDQTQVSVWKHSEPVIAGVDDLRSGDGTQVHRAETNLHVKSPPPLLPNSESVQLASEGSCNQDEPVPSSFTNEQPPNTAKLDDAAAGDGCFGPGIAMHHEFPRNEPGWRIGRDWRKMEDLPGNSERVVTMKSVSTSTADDQDLLLGVDHNSSNKSNRSEEFDTPSYFS